MPFIFIITGSSLTAEGRSAATSLRKLLTVHEMMEAQWWSSGDFLSNVATCVYHLGMETRVYNNPNLKRQRVGAKADGKDWLMYGDTETERGLDVLHRLREFTHNIDRRRTQILFCDKTIARAFFIYLRSIGEYKIRGRGEGRVIVVD